MWPEDVRLKVLFLRKRVLIVLIFIFILFYIFMLVCYNLFPFKYRDIIEREAKANNLPPSLIAAIIKAESNFVETAISKAGAKGLMQITDETARYCSEKAGIYDYDLFYPEHNIKMGAWYFNFLLSKFEGDIKLASAAYNAGEGNVRRWLNDKSLTDEEGNLVKIPYPETKKYVSRISIYKKIYDILY